MPKFVHAADLHLDSPLRGLSAYEGAPVDRIRGATRRAFEALVSLAIEEEAAFVVIAGDVYDGGWKDYGTGLFFAAQMSRLRAAGIDVHLVRGNHDAQSQITKHLRLPENVHELSSKKPERRVLDRLGVVVHGQSFGRRDVSEDLAAGYPEPLPGALNIGILHTCAEGREGHEPYAPCSLATLRAKGYQYWALGHVHKREVLGTDPWIVFPGNLQGRHAKEAGGKGATLVTYEKDRVLSAEHRDLDVFRFCRIDVDTTPAASGDDVIDLVRAALEAASGAAEGRPLAVRVLLSGSTRAHDALVAGAERWTNEIRALAGDVEGEGAWVEKVLFKTAPAMDTSALELRDDPVGQLARAIVRLRTDDDDLASVFRELAELKKILPPELREGEDALRLDDPAWQRELLGEVARSILPALLRGDEG
jgi:DNA repair protein SbcD/Mre11